MKAIPAIDLRDGACVQLVGGSFAAERIRRADVMSVVDEWQEAGFSTLHVVDLDAACGGQSNAQVVAQILDRFSGSVQVGGGIASEEHVQRLFDQGVASVVLGTKAILDRGFLERVIQRWPRRIVVAADVREQALMIRGWKDAAALSFDGFVQSLDGLPIGGLLVTAVHVEGLLQGPDFKLYEGCTSRWPGCAVTASGGIRSIEDLAELEAQSVSSAIVGMALYTGLLDPRSTAERFPL